MRNLTKVCGWCGVKYESTVARSKYCSSTCRSAVCRAKKRNSNARNDKVAALQSVKSGTNVDGMGVCGYCNKLYRFKRNTSVYCSTACRVAHFRAAETECNVAEVPFLLRYLSKIFNWGKYIK